MSDRNNENREEKQDDPFDLNSSLSFVADDEDMPYERAVRADHQKTVTSVLVQVTDLKDALKAQCGYDGPLTVAERRAIRHNKKILLTLQKQLEESMQNIKPMPVSNPASRHTSYEVVHAHSAHQSNKAQCASSLQGVTNETDTITYELSKRQMSQSEFRVERGYNRGSLNNRGSSRGRARGRVISHETRHELHTAPSPAARSRIRTSERLYPFLDDGNEDDPAIEEKKTRELQEDEKSFSSSPEIQQESQSSITSAKSHSKSGRRPRSAMSGIKERILRDKEKIKMRQKEEEEEQEVLPGPEEPSHDNKTAESDSFEYLPTVEDYLGSADVVEKEPSPISYVAEEEISSQSTLDHSQINKSDEEVTEKASEDQSETLSTAKEKDEDQNSQINSYMSDLRKKESHLRYAESGSDVEKSPDEERMQELRAISDVGRLSQPGRSSEDEDSDEELQETSSLVNAEG